MDIKEGCNKEFNEGCNKATVVAKVAKMTKVLQMAKVARAARAANNRGFTLMELMIALVIIAIVMSISVPMFSRLSTDGQLSKRANTLLSSIRVARSEAVTAFQQGTVMCPSNDGSTCLTADADSWSEGWIIFVDADNDGALDTAERIVRVVGLNNSERYSITKAEAGNLVFSSGGMMADEQETSFTLCNEQDASTAKAIFINASGQTRVGDESDGALNCTPSTP